MGIDEEPVVAQKSIYDTSSMLTGCDGSPCNASRRTVTLVLTCVVEKVLWDVNAKFLH